MPYFSIETNKKIDISETEKLTKKASKFLAEMMSKPEQVIMVAIKPGTPLIFGGTDEPCAFVRIKALGLEKKRCPEFSGKVCGFLEKEIGVPGNRAFIEFTDIDGKAFGYNGDTLGHG
jgi:phenylpyruvate tautomerase